MARELATLRLHPGFELGDPRCHALAAYRKTLLDGAAVDLALDVEDRIDALDRLDRERRQHGQRPARLGGNIGKLEELAPAMRPAAGLGDRARPACRRVEPIESGIGIRLQDPGIGGEMTLGMRGGAMARTEEERQWAGR